MQNQLKEFDEIKKLYHQAEEEARKINKGKKKAAAVPTLKHQDKHPVIKPTLNLIHLAQIYLKAQNKEEMKKNATNPQDLDIFAEFSENLFGLGNASQTYNKYNVYLNHCYHLLDKYLNASEEIAVQNTSYKYILENVEKYMNSQYFEALTTAPIQQIEVQAIVEKNVEKHVEKPQQIVEPPQKNPDQILVKTPVQEPVVEKVKIQPESPNQMLIEEDKHQEIVVKKPEEEFGEEGKFVEDHHQGQKRGGHGYRGRSKGYFNGKKHYEEKKKQEHVEQEHEGHEQRKPVENDGFVTVKTRSEKMAEHRVEGGARGTHRGRGRGNRGNNRTGEERRYHEHEHEYEYEHGHENEHEHEHEDQGEEKRENHEQRPATRGKGGNHQRGYKDRGLKKEYIIKV